MSCRDCDADPCSAWQRLDAMLMAQGAVLAAHGELLRDIEPDHEAHAKIVPLIALLKRLSRVVAK